MIGVVCLGGVWRATRREAILGAFNARIQAMKCGDAGSDDAEFGTRLLWLWC